MKRISSTAGDFETQKTKDYQKIEETILNTPMFKIHQTITIKEQSPEHVVPNDQLNEPELLKNSGSELDLGKNAFSLNDIFKFEPEELESKVFCTLDKPTFAGSP